MKRPQDPLPYFLVQDRLPSSFKTVFIPCSRPSSLLPSLPSSFKTVLISLPSSLSHNKKATALQDDFESRSNPHGSAPPHRTDIGGVAMALARGHAGLVVSGQSRLQDALTSQFVARTTSCAPSPHRVVSEFRVKGLRGSIPSKQRLAMVPRVSVADTAAASVTMAQSKSRVADTFTALKQQGKVALILYITAGDPDLNTSAEAMRMLDACGCDIIELGVPYSDPLADGPVIQAAGTRSLSKGTTLEKVLAMLKEVSPSLSAPVVLFTYYNPILKRGVDSFLKAVKEAGGSGLVVPDVPLEETFKLRESATANGIELILLTTPTTPKSRMEIIAKASRGFVYLVSLEGVTGARTTVDGRVEVLLKELKEVTDKPIAVGFGISRPEHAAQVVEWGADGVIVGSAVVKILGEAASSEEGLASLKKFTEDLKNSIS